VSIQYMFYLFFYIITWHISLSDSIFNSVTRPKAGILFIAWQEIITKCRKTQAFHCQRAREMRWVNILSWQLSTAALYVWLFPCIPLCSWWS
jgi:hypothetical protein